MNLVSGKGLMARWTIFYFW